MATEVADVKTGADSSTATTGATEASPTSTTTAADSSPQGDKKPSSISEALEKVELEMPSEETGGAETGNSQGEERQPDDPPSTEAETGETKPETVTGDKDGKLAKDGQGAQDSDVPFHTRPEWQQAMTVLKALPDGGAKLKPIIREAFQRETRANEALRALKPQADVAAELRQIVGGDKEFDTMRQVVRGFAAGDPAVIPILKQMVQTIEKSSGETISSPDLIERQATIQKQYDEGMIDQAEYQTQSNLLKEVEKNRAGKRTVETRLQQNQTEQQRQMSEAQLQQRVETINSWEGKIRERDPDFGDVTEVNDPKHGESVADQVFDAMCLKSMQNPKATTDELVSAAQRAYDRARKSVSAPALRQSRIVTSQSSSTTGRQQPRTMREAMDAVRME